MENVAGDNSSNPQPKQNKDKLSTKERLQSTFALYVSSTFTRIVENAVNESGRSLASRVGGKVGERP